MKDQLAAKFSEIVSREFTGEELLTVNSRNKQNDYAGFCATQDFCDANMLMEEAFIEIVGREADMQSEDDSQLWSDAWDISRDNEFKV